MLLRSALATVLNQEPDLEVVAELAQRDEVLRTVERERPNVAVLDFGLPGTIAVGELCRQLQRSSPNCRVLVMVDEQACASSGGSLAKLAPRVGLIATDSSPEHLVESVRTLARGQPVLDAELAVAALSGEQ